MDDLLHRAGLGHRLVERPPIRRQHRPDRGPGHRPSWHRAGKPDGDDPGGDEPDTENRQPRERDLEAGEQGDDTANDLEHPLTHPAASDLARRFGEPAALDGELLQLVVESAHLRPELEQLLVGQDVFATG